MRGCSYPKFFTRNSMGEETLASLLEPGGEYPAIWEAPRLIVVARPDGGAVMGSARDARNS